MEKQEDSDFDFIASYFNIELSQEEMAIFEKRMVDDVAFAEKVSLYQESIDIVDKIESSSEAHTRKLRWKADIKKNNKPNKVIALRWIGGIAASLIIGFATWHFMLQKPDYQLMAQNAWNKEVGLDFTVRNSTTDSTKALLNKALSVYKNKDYDKALTMLKDYDTSSNNYKDVLLLKALARYKSNRTDVALATLDTLSNYYPHISNWYKGLMYMEMNDLKSAADYLEIPDRPNQEIELKK